MGNKMNYSFIILLKFKMQLNAIEIRTGTGNSTGKAHFICHIYVYTTYSHGKLVPRINGDIPAARRYPNNRMG